MAILGDIVSKDAFLCQNPAVICSLMNIYICCKPVVQDD